MAQIKLSKQAVQQLGAIRLHSEMDSDIDVTDTKATGNVYLAVGDEGAYIELSFNADIDIHREPGEKRGCDIYCHPCAEISSVTNLTTKVIDSDDIDERAITSQVLQQCRNIIEQFIYDTEIEAPAHYECYADIA